MAEKDSTLVLKVDLGCPRCCKKIKEILDKFDEIREKKYDEKNNTITITGPFCPHKLKKKLLCRAGCIIICFVCPQPTMTQPPPPPPPPTTTTNITIAVCCIHCGHGGGSCHPPQCCQGHEKLPPCKGHEKPPPCKDHEKPPPCKDHKIPPSCYCDYGPPCGNPKKPPCGNPKKPPPCYCDYGRPRCYCGCGGAMGYDSTCKFYIEEDQQLCVIM